MGKSKGARLTKAEREARREAKQQQAALAAITDEQQGEAFNVRAGELAGLVAAARWDDACVLGSESVPLALRLLKSVREAGRTRFLAHTARRLAQCLGQVVMSHVLFTA
eukprot:4419237-Pleurochrysis_carterae.AAC.2